MTLPAPTHSRSCLGSEWEAAKLEYSAAPSTMPALGYDRSRSNAAAARGRQATIGGGRASSDGPLIRPTRSIRNTWVRGGAGSITGRERPAFPRRKRKHSARGGRKTRRKLQVPPPLIVRMQQPAFWNARLRRSPINTPDSTNNYLPVNWTYSMPNSKSYDLCYILMAAPGNIRMMRIGDNGATHMFGNEHFDTNPPKQIRNMRQTLRLTNITRTDTRAGYIRAIRVQTGIPLGIEVLPDVSGTPRYTANDKTLTYLRNIRDTAERFEQYSAEQCAHGVDFSSKPSLSVAYRSYQAFKGVANDGIGETLTKQMEDAGMETLIVFTPETGSAENVQNFQVNCYFQDACTFEVTTMLGTLMKPPPTGPQLQAMETADHGFVRA